LYQENGLKILNDHELEEMKNIIYDEKEDDYEPKNEAYDMLNALKLSNQTKVRFCDERCYQPSSDWATNFCNTINFMAGKNCSEIRE